VLGEIDKLDTITLRKRQDYRSGVLRVSALLNQSPHQIALDLQAISRKMDERCTGASQLRPKTLANIRSNFLAAVKASNLLSQTRVSKALLPAWEALLSKLASKRQRLGISRLARYASEHLMAPTDVSTDTVLALMHAVRICSLHRKPNELHRSTAVIWNEIARQFPELALRLVGVPSFRKAPSRLDWSSLPVTFRNDVEGHLTWCSDNLSFDENARNRPLASSTIRLRRNFVHAAVTALAASGVEPTRITTLAYLISPDQFRAVARQRAAANGGKLSQFDLDLLRTLVQIGREYLNLSEDALATLKKVLRSQRPQRPGLTTKNRTLLRHFDDPKTLGRLVALPETLWRTATRTKLVNSRTLAAAQAALAIDILIYFGLRIQNVAAVRFNTNILLSDRPSASTLMFSDLETKNDLPLEFPIPEPLVRKLRTYRDKFLGTLFHATDFVFVNADASRKLTTVVSDLVSRTVWRHLKIKMTVHQFRHLIAKVQLDAAPGSYETVKQLLGHKNQKTTVNFYAGIDSRRAANHYHNLLETGLRNVANRYPTKTNARSKTEAPPI
jgi:integrase